MTVIHRILSTPCVVLIFLLLRMPAIIINSTMRKTGRVTFARIQSFALRVPMDAWVAFDRVSFAIRNSVSKIARWLIRVPQQMLRAF